MHTHFRSESVAEFRCEVVGSRPPPKITWHLQTDTQTIELVPQRPSLLTGQPPSVGLDLGITINDIERSRDTDADQTINEVTSSLTPIFTLDYPALSQDGNTSSSILRLRMQRLMHQAMLKCRASNFELPAPGNQMQDELQLDVLCKLSLLLNYIKNMVVFNQSICDI